MIDNHPSPKDIDLYAVGALDGNEKQVLEKHVRSCSLCAQRLAEAQRRAASAAAPPPTAKADVTEGVRTERVAATTEPVAAPIRVRRTSWGLRFSLAFAVAAVVLGLAAFFFGKGYFEQRDQIKHLQAQLDKAQAQSAADAASMKSYSDVVSAPDTVSVTLQQQAGGTPGQGHVLYNARLGTAIYSGLISSAPADKSYQLWLVPSIGSPVSGGIVSANQQGGPVIAHFPAGLNAASFAVTLEPVGGSPQPTGPKVLVGAPRS